MTSTEERMINILGYTRLAKKKIEHIEDRSFVIDHIDEEVVTLRRGMKFCTVSIYGEVWWFEQ